MSYRFRNVFIKMGKLQHNWWDLLLVETQRLVQRNWYILAFYHQEFRVHVVLILALYFLALSIFQVVCFGQYPSKLVYKFVLWIFEKFVVNFLGCTCPSTLVACYLCHWVDGTAGGLLVPEVINSPVAIVAWGILSHLLFCIRFDLCYSV